MAWDDRFHGEYISPPIALKCDICRTPIYEGQSYYQESDTCLDICCECKEKHDYTNVINRDAGVSHEH